VKGVEVFREYRVCKAFLNAGVQVGVQNKFPIVSARYGSHHTQEGGHSVSWKLLVQELSAEVDTFGQTVCSRFR
jgi:hypothetical protein